MPQTRTEQAITRKTDRQSILCSQCCRIDEGVVHVPRDRVCYTRERNEDWIAAKHIREFRSRGWTVSESPTGRNLCPSCKFNHEDTKDTE